MKKDLKYYLRWFAVLPGSLLFGLLVLFPLHWILYASLVNGEIISGVNINPIEHNISPFISAITYIYIGSKIAPKYKFETTIALSILWILFLISIFVFMPYLQNKIQISGIGAIIGLILGIYIVKKQENSIKK